MKIMRGRRRPDRPPRFLGAATLFGIALAASGCGNVTAGGFGEADVDVSGNEAEPAPAPAASPQPAFLAPSPSSSSPPAPSSHLIEGVVDVAFALFLVSEDGATLPLGPEEIRVQVDVRGDPPVRVVEAQTISATRYTEVRLVFTEITAVVQGLVIDELPVLEVEVELAGDDLLVTRPLDFEVADRQRVALLVGLNSLTWLLAADPLLGTVAESLFASAVEVEIQ